MTNTTNNRNIYNDNPPIIKTIGLGGAGSNAIDRMIQFQIDGVDFIAANTDKQALNLSEANTKLLLGKDFTKGHGAGGDPFIGETAAHETLNELSEIIENTDILFITCGMGGGTGTGSAPVVAELAQDLGVITVAIVTMPFNFEGNHRYSTAIQGVSILQNHCDTLITVPNERLLQIVPHNVTLDVAFRMADDILRQGIQAISEIILMPGLINVDFADVRMLLHKSGGAVIAIGQGRGNSATMDAVRSALHHPLQDISGMNYANGLLVHFTGGHELPMSHIQQAINEIRASIGPSAQVTLGATVEKHLKDKVQIILVATGVGGHVLDHVIDELPSKTNHIQITETTHNQQNLESIDEMQQVFSKYQTVQHNLDTPAFLRRNKIIDKNKTEFK